MANERIILDTRSTKKDGTHPIKLYLRNKRDILISTGFYASVENFTKGEYNKNEPNYKTKNASLRSIRSTAEKETLYLATLGELGKMNDKDLRKHLLNKIFGKTSPSEESKKFVNYLEDFISTKSNKGTLSLYNTTKRKILNFDKDCTFETIDKKWLLNFEKHLIDSGLKINAYALHLRNIRAVFNYAIDEELTTSYPFRKFRIKKEETSKRCLTIEQLRMFREYPCENHQKRYRDIFILIFYLIGINIGDLLELKPGNLVNGRIEYHRKKTHKLYSIKVEPEAMEIINRYKGVNYLLNIMDEYQDYQNFTHRMNLVLKQIGEVKLVEKKIKGKKRITKEYKPLFAHISSYWARHTWATIAASLDIPKETISEALGHEIGSNITSIYIKFDRKKVDEANRKVIDYINSLK